MKLGAVFISVLTLSQFCLASTNSCQSSAANSIGVTGSQTVGSPIAAAGLASPNADDFATLDAAAIPGCSTIDTVFNNLNATSTVITAGTGSAPAVSNAGTYISLGTNLSLATGSVDAVFSTVRGADNTTIGGSDTFGDTTANDGTNNWVSDRKAAVSYTVDYQFTTTASVQFFVLSLNGITTGQGGGLAPTVSTVNLCLGGSWSSGGTGGTCSSGKVDNIALATGTTIYNLDLGAQYSTIGIQNNFQLDGGNANNGQQPTFLTSFDESFDETPEPATFILMGSALAGIAALRFRKRGQA